VDLDKLKQAEGLFLARYPGGFDDPAMVAIKKKHDIDKLAEFARTNLTRAHFNQPEKLGETLVKIVSRSSMVSRFEKPGFKDFINSLNSHEKQALADAFEKRLYGRNKRQGFEEILGMLSHHKMAKWSVISVVPFYLAPRQEVFVKPTTAKGILAYLDVPDLHYNPRPSWDFYCGYQQLLKEIKKQVTPSLSPNNAALSGFLMMSL
jgi:hypothetical protein